MKKFEWAVVGSGIAGMVISEILTREGHSTVLIEKNEKLASETTRDFHEWIHTGSLYTLIPDNLLTLKYILGAIDDLLEYYNCFQSMNLEGTEKGLKIKNMDKAWFEENKIHFKFRVKGRKITIPWLLGVARSIFLVDRIKEHDWLRRRAGIVDPFKLKYKEILKLSKLLLKYKKKFYDYETSDFTTNSRIMLRELISAAIDNGLYVSTSNEFKSWEKKDNSYIVHCKCESFFVEKLVLCLGDNISKFVDAKVKTSYAPLAVVRNINKDIHSFVELDYYPKNCINIVKKEKNISLIGGISFSNQEACEPYIDQVIKKHKAYSPELEVLHKYNGIKSEIIFKNQPRNYLYNIKQIQKGVWSIVPGKATLGFSIAPEFYRQIYKKNPRKYFNISNSNGKYDDLVSNTVWYDVAMNHNEE
jgi:hypothetical protein